MGQVSNSRKLRRTLFGVAALGAAAALPLTSSTAAPTAKTSKAAARVVTFTFSNSGKGRFKTSGDTDIGSIALNYTWKGTAKARIPAAALKNPSKAKFSTRGTATLTGSWVGDLTGKQFGTVTPGEYHCSYKGTNVKIKTGFEVKTSRKRGKISLVLTSIPTSTDWGFFPAKGNGATISCANEVGSDGPPHFEPGWLFRDSYNDNLMLSYQAAVIDVPAKLLPKGTVKMTWPREVGTVNSPLRAKLDWSNLGKLTIRAR